MARFVEVPTFDIYNEETGEWAEPEQWWLEGRMVYASDYEDRDGNPLVVVTPDGFKTDLSSIPRFPPFLRSILLKNGRHRPASIPHDDLCRRKFEFPRPLADRIFLEAMEVVGVNRFHRYAMYAAVRALTEILIWQGKAARNWEDCTR
jgi:hypothetical protein